MANENIPRQILGSVSQELDISMETLDDDYLVYTDDEANEAVAEFIEETLWAFNPSFLADVTGFSISIFKAIAANGKCEDNNDAIRQLADENMEKLVSKAIRLDGRGHFLSQYDGREIEVIVGDTTYYVYRQN